MDEFELISRLIERLPPQDGSRVRLGPGDDAAVGEPTGPTATTVDAIVEGVHFTLPEYSAAAVGRKALATALSDLAAMGAEPGEAYVVLGVRDGIDEQFLLDLHEGMAELAETTGTVLAGGDIVRSPALLVSVTAVGHEADGAGFVTRAGASPGEVLAVTGELGGAAAGLRQVPEPRLEAGLALARGGATAMIDISDGLGADAAHIAEASGVRLEIDADRVPVEEGASREQALGGGEDYELLVALPPDALEDAKAAVAETGVELTQIGEVAEGSGSSLPADGFKHDIGHATQDPSDP